MESNTKAYLDMELLRFTTAGSVDDGKSTLIGRLLYDSKSIFEDQLEAVKKASIQKGDEHINLALFTDGLRSERQQGITIDVAYRYFHTPKRKFIIADTPGHIQYTRNMVTGASTAHAAVILVDARNGVTEQTRRHYYLAWLLGIKHVIVCINKMDLVEFNQQVFESISADIVEISNKLNGAQLHFIPISALHGDNVVEASENMPWYQGPTLLEKLESIDVRNHLHEKPLRLPVQYVIRPISDKYHDYRGYAGRIESGTLKVGDEILILPGEYTTRVISIHCGETYLEEAFPPMSVAITIADDIDIERGNLIVHPVNKPKINTTFEATLCWLNPIPLKINKLYTLRHTTFEARCKIINQKYLVDINSLEQHEGQGELKMNEIGVFIIKTSKPIVFDAYKHNRATGSFILIDEDTNETVGAGMIHE